MKIGTSFGTGHCLFSSAGSSFNPREKFLKSENVYIYAEHSLALYYEQLLDEPVLFSLPQLVVNLN